MAQTSFYDSINKRRYQIARTGFITLGSWAALNIVAGLIGRQHSTGERKQFFRATTIAGAIDMLFAGVGYITTNRIAARPHDVVETFKKQALAEKVFLVSVGLDIGVVAYGLYTKERANRFTGEKSAWLNGAGKTLLLQGSFLILFDGILYILQAKNGKRLHQKLQSLSLSGI
jgi:hypothetical protein